MTEADSGETLRKLTATDPEKAAEIQYCQAPHPKWPASVLCELVQGHEAANPPKPKHRSGPYLW